MFSKKPEQSSPMPVRKPMANNSATFSVLGTDVTITGDIEASADLHVDGTVKGDLSCASLGSTFGMTVVVRSGLYLAFGCFLFSRRELAEGGR